MSTPESAPTHLPRATLCQSRLCPPVRDFGFGLGGGGGVELYEVNTSGELPFTPPLSIALEMDLPASKSFCPAPYKQQVHYSYTFH